MPANLRVQLEFYDVNLSWLGAYRSALNDGEPVSLAYDFERLGTFFVRVLDAGSRASTQPIRLRFSFMPAVDSCENNDDIGHSALLTNSTVQAFSFPASDVDWHRC